MTRLCERGRRHQVRRVTKTIRREMRHGGFFSDVSGVSRSNGLMTARITLVATCA